MLKIKNKIPSALIIGDKIVERVLIKNEVVWERRSDYLYLENTYAGNNTISIQQTLLGEPDSSLYTKTLQYSKDKKTWTTITLSSTPYTITLNEGEKVYFRGNEGVFNYWLSGGTKYAITNITGTESHIVGGNINSLIDYSKTLPQGAFNGIFENDSKLLDASNLILPSPSDGRVSPFAYLYMFRKCTSLTTPPPIIPGEIQGQDACNGMFANTAITSVPILPATTLAKYCYRAMFANTPITSAPILPATTLVNYCYNEMFYKCTSLITPPELPAKTLVNSCYRAMFYGCTSLNNLTVYADDISATDCTTNWLQNVATEGIFNNMGTATYTINSPSGIPVGWVENKNEYFYIENKHNGTNNIYLKTLTNYDKTDTGEFATTLQYSKDKINWTTIKLDYEYTIGSVQLTTKTNLTLLLNEGEKVYFRNDSGYFGYVGVDIGSHQHMFTSDENIKVGGNIKSLLDYRDMNGTTLKKGCFNNLFSGADKLSDAGSLILSDTNLSESCYMSLFERCYSLTNHPVLPATNLAEYCYVGMFAYTAITTAPVLPATNLAPYCYKNLFESCHSLTSAPTLPAMILAEGCYQGMFNGSYYLTTAPVLPARTLVENCYRYLFMGCSRLNSVTSYANDISATECTRWWLDTVAEEGTFRNLGDAIYSRDGDGIPEGWTEVKS